MGIIYAVRDRHFLHPAYEAEGLCEECGWKWLCPTMVIIRRVLPEA